MATLTRLASTLTAKYFPSQTLTDAFYIDGRLFGKRETRQADITIDKEERGFLLSVFAHPNIPDYEPGMMPPYEPELRHTCNEVKFGRKEIDGMIEGFLTTAVDVTGKTKLADDNRSPYFSGVIVRDAEAFAVTIGSGLAFLYRDDVLFPLTDAGIPMEPIDVDGNRVADFLYYCSSKTANALWSNFFTLSPDDCIILCNKEIYDALGQREILRILAEADDQCDAAGVIITQASARMPNVPMQFSISFVESVTSDEKRGLFGFKKKSKEVDTSDMSIKSTFEGGIVGAAAEASANAGFAGGLMMTDAKEDSSFIMFGDTSKSPEAPSVNQVASTDKGIEVNPVVAANPGVEFLDTSISKEPVEEISAEDMMRSLFGKPEPIVDEPKAATSALVGTAAAAVAAADAVANTSEPVIAVTSEEFNPFAAPDDNELVDEPKATETVVESPFMIPEENDNAKTKPIEKVDSEFIASLQNEAKIKKDGIIEAALREMGASIDDSSTTDTEPAASEDVIDVDKLFAMPEAIVPETEVETPVVSESGELVFTEAATTTDFGGVVAPSSDDSFDPYSAGDAEEMKSAAPLVFGDNAFSEAPNLEVESNGTDIPEFKLVSEEPKLEDKDKLPVDFPVIKEEAPVVMAAPTETTEAPVEEMSLDELVNEESGVGEFSLPFANVVETIPEEKPVIPEQNDIPEMPLYNVNTFDTPVAAVNSEEPVNSNPEDVYTYGQYQENENMSDSYEPFDSDANNYSDFTNAGNEGYQYYQNDVNQNNYTNYSNNQSYYPDEGIDMDQPYQASEASYTDLSYAANTAEEPVSDGDDWINGILGLDGSNNYQSYADTADTANAYDAYATTAYNSQPAASASYQPVGSQPVAGTTYPNGRQTTARTASGGGNRNMPPKKRVKLNRNGYIFIAFVVLMLICFIILISVIARSCSKKNSTSDTVAESVTETTPIEITEPSDTVPPQPVTPENDPLAPENGMFYFSDNIGYKSWWDLFNKVYDIQLESESDSRVQILLDYNNYYLQLQGQAPIFTEGYKPSAGDMVLLPSLEVISGAVVIPDMSGATTEPSTGDLGVVDGSTDSSVADTSDIPSDGSDASSEEAGAIEG